MSQSGWHSCWKTRDGLPLNDGDGADEGATQGDQCAPACLLVSSRALCHTPVNTGMRGRR
jgi:hypothetical protein